MLRLQRILTAPRAGAPLVDHDAITAVAGRGLLGDRYYHGCGTFSGRAGVFPGVREVSIIDAGAIALCNQRLGTALDAAAFRRNLVVEGLPQRPRRGARLAIGEVVLEILSSCPPCGYLARLWGADARAGLHGIGGVRARIVVGGRLTVGAAAALVHAG